MTSGISCRPVVSSSDWRSFDAVITQVYAEYPCHRATDHDLTRLVSRDSRSFLSHAAVHPFLLCNGALPVGRFALIRDGRMPDCAQVSFFEALPGLQGVCNLLREACTRLFPECRRMVVGLNGHVNYGAGILVDRFDEPPVFGLPYNPPYYVDYFGALKMHGMASYRFETAGFHEYAKTERHAQAQPVHIRTMRKSALTSEVRLYTELNNLCFHGTSYWSDRTPDEDLELFHPFRWFIDDRNLLFAEIDGATAGFILWYPDFNQLARHGEPLGFKHLLKYRFRSPVTAFRLAEIGVIPEFQNTAVADALIVALSRIVEHSGFTHCEAGFIFDDNRPSTLLTRRYIKRALGSDMAPHRRFAVFEGRL